MDAEEIVNALESWIDAKLNNQLSSKEDSQFYDERGPRNDLELLLQKLLDDCKRPKRP